MDLEAAENAWRDPRDQISYKKTIWKCPCNGCKKAEKRERERVASLIQEQHLLAAEGEERKYGLRMVECRYGGCDCYAIIDMIMEDPK
ncbi:MAG: hypothetical protein RLZZ196_328 [Bacteroidota bacterium]|jgi:hypothetical protein